MHTREKPHWKASLHGGHSGAYCDHAEGTLRHVLEAAVAQGFHTYGVTEHAPRLDERFLYEEEKELGWDVAKLKAHFEAYARDLRDLSEEFDDRLTVLRGFEIEVVPASGYAQIMRAYRERFQFEYIVGSVHYVDEILIDGPKEDFQRAVDRQGGLEELVLKYYATVAQMVQHLQPEVVGHLDIVRKNAPSGQALETPRLRRAAEEALEVIRHHHCILDLNVNAYRKGLDNPYPAPWLLKAAHRMGIPFCFGDDSHGPEEVGAGLEDGRTYLLQNGVPSITILAREQNGLVPKTIPLD